MYLFAIIDWYSRKIISWQLSNTLDVDFCLRCLKRGFRLYGHPEIMNTDHGSRFTSEEWQKLLNDADVKISIDGKGRWIDNVMIEQFCRTIKYEEIYLKSYCSPNELERGIAKFMLRYNSVRPHKTLDRLTPDEVYGQKLAKIVC
jgi:putative transposase